MFFHFLSFNIFPHEIFLIFLCWPDKLILSSNISQARFKMKPKYIPQSSHNENHFAKWKETFKMRWNFCTKTKRWGHGLGYVDIFRKIQSKSIKMELKNKISLFVSKWITKFYWIFALVSSSNIKWNDEKNKFALDLRIFWNLLNFQSFCLLHFQLN